MEQVADEAPDTAPGWRDIRALFSSETRGIVDSFVGRGGAGRDDAKAMALAHWAEAMSDGDRQGAQKALSLLYRIIRDQGDATETSRRPVRVPQGVLRAVPDPDDVGDVLA